MRPRPRSILLLGAKVLLALLPALLVLEMALRFLPGAIPPGVLLRFEPGLRERIARGRFATKRDTVLVERDDGGPPLRLWKPHAVVPNRVHEPGAVESVTMDNLGFCNPAGLPSGARIDVAALGDSFTWCQSVDPTNTWVQGLARLTGLAVYNLGRAGIGPYEELQILRLYGLSRRPQLVILNLYEGNDLRDITEYDAYRRQHTSGAAVVASDDTWWHHTWPGRHSYAANLLLAIPAAWQRSAPRPNFRYRLRLGTATVEFNADNTDTDEIVYARRLAAGTTSLDLFQPALAEFARLGRVHHFQPVVVYTPSAHTAYAPFVEFHDAGATALLAEFSRRQREYFAATTARLDLPFLDATPALAAAALTHTNRQDLLYFPRNLHLTPAGHRVLAEAIVAGLEQAAVIPSR